MIGGKMRIHFTPPPIRAKSGRLISKSLSLRYGAAMVPAFRVCKPLETIRPVRLDYPHTPPNARALHDIRWLERPRQGHTIRTEDREVIESAILSAEASPGVSDGFSRDARQ